MFKLITLHPLFLRGKVMSCTGLYSFIYMRFIYVRITSEYLRATHLGGAHSRPVRHAVERTGKTVLELFESEFIFFLRLCFLTLIKASLYIYQLPCVLDWKRDVLGVTTTSEGRLRQPQHARQAVIQKVDETVIGSTMDFWWQRCRK